MARYFSPRDSFYSSIGVRRRFSEVLLLDRGVVFAVAEVGTQLAQFLAQMDHGLGVDLRHARLRNAQRALDLLERLTVEVVQPNNGAFLRREGIDGAHELGAHFALLDFGGDVALVVLERVDQRDLVAFFVREKLFEREHRGAAYALNELIELAHRESHPRGGLFFGRGAAELEFEFLMDAFQLAGALPYRARDPVKRTQGVENRPVDTGDRVRLELHTAAVVVFLDGVDQTQNTVVDQIVDLDVRGKIDRDATGHVLHEMQVLVNDLFSGELHAADDVAPRGAVSFHRIPDRRAPGTPSRRCSQ